MPLIEEIKVPLLAVNDTTLTVVELSCPPGAKVTKGDAIMVFETSKTTYDVEAQTEGYIQYLCTAGRDYEVNEIVARLYSEQVEALAAPIPMPAAGALAFAPEPLARWDGEPLFSHEASRLMAANNLEASAFTGRDLVTAADILQLLQPAPAAHISTETPSAATNASASSAGRATRAATAAAGSPISVDPMKAVAEKLTSAKRREIEYLSEVQEAGLTSTIHTYIETDGIFTPLNRSLRYLKNSLLPLIVYEVSRLLTDYPLLNAWFTGDGIAQYKDVNPGFAIDIDKGLKVAKIAAAGQKSLQEIEAAILSLSGDYLDDKLRLEDLTDITFTITDLSAEAVALFQPLINKMNSAILGISAIDEKWQRCTLSLTFDHRVTEGRSAARFLKELKSRLESYRPSQEAIKKDIACFKCFKTLAEDLGHTGFMQCITPEGKEGYICQSCLKGF
jgi:pyruvate dehydrogenase E2 component (dihydrolipoamide acetyltransferase)